MKLVLSPKFFGENSCTEFYENPTNRSLADTRSHTDGRMWSPHKASVLYIVKDANHCGNATSVTLMRCLATHRQKNRFNAGGFLKLATSFSYINILLAYSRGNLRADYRTISRTECPLCAGLLKALTFRNWVTACLRQNA